MNNEDPIILSSEDLQKNAHELEAETSSDDLARLEAEEELYQHQD